MLKDSKQQRFRGSQIKKSALLAAPLAFVLGIGLGLVLGVGSAQARISMPT